MPPKLALLVYFGFIVWLLKHATRRGWSKELWIPLTWILIVGSKTPATWIAVFTQSGRDSEGSSLDIVILIGLLVAGFRVLARRRTNWQAVMAHNKWLFIYFAYIGISVLWADQPFGSLKLWVKDAGNLIMVLVILSGQHPGKAVKSTLLKASYILIPISVLLIKYFPDIGRGYDRWTYQPIMLGASDSKNSLGATILVCAFALLWDTFGWRVRGARGKLITLAPLALVIMTLWLLLSSNCATAVACMIIAVVILVILKGHVARDLTQKLGLSVLIVVPLVVLLLHFVFDLGQTLVGTLGRDLTLTARTNIWQACLGADINPLFGTGYSSFWYGERARSISENLGFFFNLKEAHNGYFETYLNSGLLGLFFLVCAIATGTARILRQLGNGTYETVRLTFVVVALIYNVSESAFAGLNPIWFLLLLVLVQYPARKLSATHDTTLQFLRESTGSVRTRDAQPADVYRGFESSPSPLFGNPTRERYQLEIA